MKTIGELKKELAEREREERYKVNTEIERQVLEKLNTLVGKCYMKNCQGNQKLFYKFSSDSHTYRGKYSVAIDMATEEGQLLIKKWF